jgi:hypothetical protein
MRYDALKTPDPEAWLDLDEQERIDQVIEYHRRHHLPMGEFVNRRLSMGRLTRQDGRSVRAAAAGGSPLA